MLTLAGRRVLGVDLPRTRDLGPIVAVWLISLLLLIFESDVGMSAVLMGLFVAMLYIATSRTSWLLIGLVMFVLGAALAATLFSHVGARFTCWIHPFAGTNPSNACFQPVQGLFGMANGGLLGKGLGGGEPYWTPLVQSDFVFTGFGEELGLAGVMALLLIYGLIVQRGLRTALMVKDPYSKLLAGGLVVHVRAAGLRDRRRRHPADPADRHHHAVPLPGRVEPRRELDTDRHAGAAERHRSPPGAPADPGRGADSGGVAEVNRALKRISIAVLVMFLPC